MFISSRLIVKVLSVWKFLSPELSSKDLVKYHSLKITCLQARLPVFESCSVISNPICWVWPANPETMNERIIPDPLVGERRDLGTRCSSDQRPHAKLRLCF